MRTLLMTAIASLVSIFTFAQPSVDKILGTWESTDSDPQLRFEFFKKGDAYFGKLLWASNMYEEDGETPKKDFKNPDKKLQGRSRKGIINITDLRYEAGEYRGGKLYNPTDGRIYSVKGKLTSENELDFRGFLGFSLLGKTMKFKRVQQSR